MQYEYEEGLAELGTKGMAFYKFFSLFRVTKQGHVCFGREIVDDTVSPETAQLVRDYVKEQKEWIREVHDAVPVREAHRRMWWMVQKMFDLGLFCSSEHRTVMCWYDMTLDFFRAPSSPSSK